MASRDRALNYAVRVKGQQEAVAAFRTVGQVASQSIDAIAAASAAAGAHDEAVARATNSAAAFGVAQAEATRKMAEAKAAFAAGTSDAEHYQRAVADAKSGLSVFKAENQAAARAVDATARTLVAAQQEAADYGRQLAAAKAAGAAPVATGAVAPDRRTGAQRLVAGDASVDRAAVSSATLEQVLGRVATRGQQVTAAMNAAAQAEREAATASDAQATAADRLRARYNPLYATVTNYLTTKREIRQAELAGTLTTNEATAALQRERQATLGAIAAIKLQTAEIAAGTRAQRAGFTNLGFQINDVTTQLSAGTPVAQVFAQQSGQVLGAFQMMAKEGSTAASVLGGPWGLAITAGVSLLGLFASKLFDASHGFDSMVQKLKEDADEQDKTNAAHVAFSKTLEGQIVLQQKLNEEMERGLKSQRETNQQNLTGAQQKIDDAQRTLSTLSRDLVTAQAALKDVYNTAPDTMTASASAAYSQRLAEAKAKVADIERRIQTAYKDIATAQQGVRDAKAVIAVDEAQAAVDPLKQIANKYQDLRDAAIAAAKGNDALTKSLTETLKAINVKEQAERDAEEKRRKSGRDTETTAFSMPVNGPISGQFGEKRPGHLHAGLDIAVPVGTPVKADAGGVIIEAGTLPGYGNVVFIDHGGGTISRLAHLSKIDVTKGQVVTAGDVIGSSGGAKGAPGSGDSTGPHLHYEVRVRGRSVDPRKGPFPTDALGSADKAADAQKRAEEEAQRQRDEAIRHQKEFDDQSARLDSALLSAKRANINDADVIARLNKEQVLVEQQKTEVDIKAKVALGDYTDAQGRVLIEKSKQLAAEELWTIATEQAARHIQDAADTEIDVSRNNLDLLDAQQVLAKTVADRRDIALEILSEEEKQARIAAQKTIYDYAIGQATKAQYDAAQRALANIDKLHPLKVESINRQNQGALGKYLQDTDPKTINDRVETLVTNELTQVRDGIDDALTNALGVKDPMLKGLLEIFLDKVLFRPIAEALKKGNGAGGDGGFGTILSSLLGGGGGGKHGHASHGSASTGLGGINGTGVLMDDNPFAANDNLSALGDAAGKATDALNAQVPALGVFGNALLSMLSGSVSGGGGFLQGALGIASMVVGSIKGGGGGVGKYPGSNGTVIMENPFAPGVSGFASGTDDLPRGLSWVGENGKELLFNGGGGRISVLNNQQSRQMRPAISGGGGGVTVVNNFNSPQPGNPRRIGAVVSRSAQLGAARAVNKGLAAPRGR